MKMTQDMNTEDTMLYVDMVRDLLQRSERRERAVSAARRVLESPYSTDAQRAEALAVIRQHRYTAARTNR